MSRTILLTGSNRGDRAALLESARERIAERIGAVVTESSINESEPWGFSDETLFLNQVIAVETELTALEVLDEIQLIEQELGRVTKTERNENGERIYESRPIDIDILFYDDQVVVHERLTIPHPLIRERQFVLVLLREIMPDYTHPVYQKQICEL